MSISTDLRFHISGIDEPDKAHCNFCGRDNHDESKCFKKMEALEAAMKKHHISLDSSSESTSHGHALVGI